MKSLLRNMLSVLRRYKMATLLNVIGLSVAFAAFMVIMMQVRYERTYDRCHPTADKVFRVELTNSGHFNVILPRAFVDAVIPSSPHIVASTLINPFIGDVYFTVENGETKTGFSEPLQTCYPDIVNVFNFPIVEGDADCLNQPNNVIIPESMAWKMFGDDKAIGSVIHAEQYIWSKNDDDMSLHDFTVGAVYRDFPGNTQLRNVVYTAIDDGAKNNFAQSNYICYVLLDDARQAEAVAENFNSHFDFSNIGRPDEAIKLMPLTDIYYENTATAGNIFRCGDKSITRLLIGIAFLILVIACINYTNFSNAMTPIRMKNINTQKVFGATNGRIRFALIGEAVIISVVSWLLSLLLIRLLSGSHLLSFVDAEMTLSKNRTIVVASALVAVLAGVLAELYPSRYITSFPAALVLKGNFGLSPKGRKFRTALVGFQFVISIAIIIAAAFMQLQNRYMQRYSFGFDSDQIAVVALNNDLFSQHGMAYANKLKTYPEVEDVAFASQKIGADDIYTTSGSEYKGQEFSYFMLTVSPNFLSTMGIEMEEGRDFVPSDCSTTTCIFNASAKEKMDMDLGSFNYYQQYKADIVGFTKDMRITSLRLGENNVCFFADDEGTPVSFIRLKAGFDVHEAVKHIQETLSEIDASYPFNIEFYDEIFNQLYHDEIKMSKMISVFGLLTVLISLMGVFGLVMFDSEYRRKEIGIRKVFGSTTNEILALFNKTYLKIVCICFVIAAPIAYYFVDQWMKGFAYTTPMYWWVFALSFLVVAAVTLVTVTIQNRRAANTNPLDSIHG